MSRPPKPLKPKANVKRGRLPFGPLYDELCSHQLRTAQEIAAFYGCDQRIVRAWASKGVGTYLADRLAVRLKVLPYVVWGDAFFADELMEAELSRRGGRRQAFTDDDVRDLRARVAAGEPISVLAREYGMSRQTIYGVASRRTYGYVA